MTTGGEALAQQLGAEGVRGVFAVPGAQLDWAFDGIAKMDGALQVWTTRHEQGAAYMADGYARASADIGVFMVVPGPGIINAGAALATGYACSSRMLAIVGQLPSEAIGRRYGLLHEVEGQSQLIRSLTKWAALASTPHEIPRLVRTAISEIRRGRPRPAAVEIPSDVLASTCDATICRPQSPPATSPDEHDVMAAAELIRHATAPVIVAGGGVLASRASSELLALGRRIAAPIAMTRNGRGAISDLDVHAVGPLGMACVLASADLVIVVGSRFMGLNGTPVKTHPRSKVILLNADPHDMGPPRVADVRIAGDAKEVLDALCAAVDRRGTGGLESRVEAARRTSDRMLAEVEPQMKYVRALRAAIPGDGVLVNELTQIGYVAGLAYPVHEPGTFLTPGYQGTLGYGFPAALGAKLALGERRVVSITGDGGFGWCLSELATACKYGIGTTTVVFDDNAYGNVLRTQKEEFEGRVIGAELKNPDFVALARAFGVQAALAESPEELRRKLAEYACSDEPSLVVVPVGELPSPWRLVAAGTRGCDDVAEAQVSHQLD